MRVREIDLKGRWEKENLIQTIVVLCTRKTKTLNIYESALCFENTGKFLNCKRKILSLFERGRVFET